MGEIDELLNSANVYVTFCQGKVFLCDFGKK